MWHGSHSAGNTKRLLISCYMLLWIAHSNSSCPNQIALWSQLHKVMHFSSSHKPTDKCLHYVFLMESSTAGRLAGYRVPLVGWNKRTILHKHCLFPFEEKWTLWDHLCFAQYNQRWNNIRHQMWETLGEIEMKVVRKCWDQPVIGCLARTLPPWTNTLISSSWALNGLLIKHREQQDPKPPCCNSMLESDRVCARHCAKLTYSEGQF